MSAEISELRNMVQDLSERVSALELGIAGDCECWRLLGLTPTQAQIVALLMKRQMVSREAFAIVLWGIDCNEARSAKLIDCHLSHIRKRFGISIQNLHGGTWSLTPQEKHRLKLLLSAREGAVA